MSRIVEDRPVFSTYACAASVDRGMPNTRGCTRNAARLTPRDSDHAIAKENAFMAVTNIARFERFFRVAASLDVDKGDLKRYSDFVNHKLYDLLLRGEAATKANGRDVIAPFDLPITKGLQERIHEFRKIDQEIELKPILDALAARPPLDLAYSDETEEVFPEIVGGMSVALARSFKIIEPALKNPQTRHWEYAFRLFDLLL
jgi:hypothetical protein